MGRCSSSIRKAALGPLCGDAGAGVGGEAARAGLLLTLHGPDGERLVGFDNAHPVERQKRGQAQDHRHRLRTIKGYDYRTLRRCSKTSGPWWTPCCANEE
jgi:hypothetical protein